MVLLRTCSPLEEELGMTYYSTGRKGIGGVLRQRPEDFVVEEITQEGLIANLDLQRLDRGEGKHTLAVLKKTSRDLMPTTSLLSKKLGAKVGFAGIKDRRAVTYQLISIDRSVSDDLPLNMKNVELKPVGRSRWPLMPGELRGNRFTITIRSIEPDAFDPQSLLPVDWLPGYFGHQRFGTTRPNTHKVGRLLVRKDYEGAVREFLAEPYGGEPEPIHQARSALNETWDLGKAYQNFPTTLTYERNMIKRMLATPGDYEGAFGALPKALLRLFVNSYQSYLFNLALSKRWELHGLFEAGEGDYVAPLDSWGSPSRPIRSDRSNIEKLQRMISARRAVLMIRVVGRETLLNGTDRDIYDEILKVEDISLEDFAQVLGMPFMGTLRFATFSPMDYEVIGHGPDELNQDRMKAVIKFSLPKGCYATVLLRELMRPVDPSAAGF
ncbi:MAG: tRNA pseudouridine(13) synthase TruD [Candidatus Verstraetearchaeota archaeon]|nr:tRNA pseudouridine(13) synthase TruD [Candidatus Verstraetearchaeota archaeon]